jgi:uncharacterized membrane protein
MATVAALFKRYEDAEQAIKQLNDLGYGKESISVAAPEAMIQDKLSVSEDVQEDATKTGAIFGGLAGLLVGVGVILVPGVGPLLSAGALATALGSTAAGAGIGAATGGFRGALKNLDVPEADARVIEEGLKNGGILVTVITEEEQVSQVKEVMRSSDAVNLEARRSTTGEMQENWNDEITGTPRQDRKQ